MNYKVRVADCAHHAASYIVRTTLLKTAKDTTWPGKIEIMGKWTTLSVLEEMLNKCITYSLCLLLYQNIVSWFLIPTEKTCLLQVTSLITEFKGLGIKFPPPPSPTLVLFFAFIKKSNFLYLCADITFLINVMIQINILGNIHHPSLLFLIQGLIIITIVFFYTSWHNFKGFL